MLLGAILLFSIFSFGQEIRKSEKITSEGWGLSTNVATTKLDGVATSKDYFVSGVTTNRFDGTMIIILNSDSNILLADLNELKNLSIKLENKESTTFKNLDIYGGGSGKLYIFKGGFAGFVQTNTKQLDKLINNFVDYLKK